MPNYLSWKSRSYTKTLELPTLPILSEGDLLSGPLWDAKGRVSEAQTILSWGSRHNSWPSSTSYKPISVLISTFTKALIEYLSPRKGSALVLYRTWRVQKDGFTFCMEHTTDLQLFSIRLYVLKTKQTSFNYCYSFGLYTPLLNMVSVVN